MIVHQWYGSYSEILCSYEKCGCRIVKFYGALGMNLESTSLSAFYELTHNILTLGDRKYDEHSHFIAEDMKSLAQGHTVRK